jgi:hypothetical protein
VISTGEPREVDGESGVRGVSGEGGEAGRGCSGVFGGSFSWAKPSEIGDRVKTSLIYSTLLQSVSSSSVRPLSDEEGTIG